MGFGVFGLQAALAARHYPATLRDAAGSAAAPREPGLPARLHACRSALALGRSDLAGTLADQALTLALAWARSPVWAWRCRVHLALARGAAGNFPLAESLLDHCRNAPGGDVPDRSEQLGVIALATGHCRAARGRVQGALHAYAAAEAQGRASGDGALAIRAAHSRARLLLLTADPEAGAHALDGAALFLGSAAPTDRTRHLALRALLCLAAGHPLRALPACEALLWQRPCATGWDRAVAAWVAAAALPRRPWRESFLTLARRWESQAGDPALCAWLARNTPPCSSAPPPRQRGRAPVRRTLPSVTIRSTGMSRSPRGTCATI